MLILDQEPRKQTKMYIAAAWTMSQNQILITRLNERIEFLVVVRLELVATADLKNWHGHI